MKRQIMKRVLLGISVACAVSSVCAQTPAAPSSGSKDPDYSSIAHAFHEAAEKGSYSGEVNDGFANLIRQKLGDPKQKVFIDIKQAGGDASCRYLVGDLRMPGARWQGKPLSGRMTMYITPKGEPCMDVAQQGEKK
ncbi:hypothetical protein WT83_27290 [Burkholderia territorii]|uniref:Lipoprotein n=1 Tax=Burkholderia territorii TaxID=1503055 RepID=A0A119VE97_9BURK|nr:hypothetical protein [Burkholderia territorii]KVV40878.1 hypothetical protein WT27_13195 [Burkholderia territorii]KVX33825.1 hypothetical protein WT31_09095 [Burkholderia territorii]KWN06391.1 hypothetical protein WT83_27290 [Burkholderia territorii]